MNQLDETIHESQEVLEEEKASFFRQPKAVWATALAAVFSFMGIGLVDPILPAIAENLQASPSQVSLLFTSYFLVTAVAMLITGFVSSRIGGKTDSSPIFIDRSYLPASYPKLPAMPQQPE